MKLFLRIMLMANVCICLLFQLNANPKKSNRNNYFIENKGQWNDEIRFLTSLNGMNAWITDDGVVYDFYTFADGKDNYELPITNYELLGDLGLGARGLGLGNDGSRKGHVVKMSFQRSGKLSESLELSKNYRQQFIGMNKSETYYNYFIGNDKSKWASFVPLYEEVLIKNVYAGIDFRFYFDNGMLRYDLNISPFADLNKIKMKFEGQESLGINDNGELVIGTSIGNVQHQQLYAWQEAQDKKVNCNFKIDENGLVGFGAKDYKKEMALVIDPLVWSTFFGGSNDEIFSIAAADSNANIYIYGVTKSQNFPITTGAYQEKLNGDYDICLVKLRSNSDLIWSTYMGSSDFDGSQYIATKTNAVWISGITSGTDFPISSNAFQKSNNGGNADAFITKFDTYGNLVYSTYFGGENYDLASCIAIDTKNNCWLVGRTMSSVFYTTSNAFKKNSESYDAFIIGFDKNCNLIYSTLWGGSNDDTGESIIIDNENSIIISGVTNSNNYFVTNNSTQKKLNGGWDAFVLKLDSNVNISYSSYFGGSGNDYGSSITTDKENKIIMSGFSTSADLPTSINSFQSKKAGSIDAFIVKFNNNYEIGWLTYFGGSDDEAYDIWAALGGGVHTDNEGNIAISSVTRSNDLVTSNDALSKSLQGSRDVFLAIFDENGLLNYSTYIGGKGVESEFGFTYDNENNLILVGYTNSDDFPVTQNALFKNLSGDNDGFIMKFSFSNCDSRSLSFNNFHDTEKLILLNDTKKNDSVITMTPSNYWKRGSVWYKEKVPVKKGFITEFSFKFSEGVNKYVPEAYPGADGIAFVIQNSSQNAIGSPGAGLGYKNIPNSLAVEFDTYKNADDNADNYHDPNENHIGVFCNGVNPNTPVHGSSVNLATADSILDLMPDGRIFYSKIEYEYNNYFRIYLDSTYNFTLPPLIELSGVDLSQLIKLDSEEFAWVGFTSATGNAYEKHEILSWSFCPTPTNAVLVGVENDEIISESSENLLDIFPNPAFDILNIEYSIANAGNVSIEVFDVLGNKIKAVDYGFVESGFHHVVLSLSQDEQTGLNYFPSGMYYLVLRTNDGLLYGKFGVMK